MKKKIFKYVIEYAIVLALIALYAYMVVGVISSATNVIYAIGFCVLGFLITLFVSSLVHELGHVIFGLISGLKLHSLTVLFIKITFSKGKFPKLKFVFPNDFGATEFLPKTREKYYGKLCISALGGLIFSVVYMAVGIVFLYLGNFITYCFFGITFPITAYILLINLIAFDETCDGYLIFTYLASGKTKKIISNCLTALCDIMLGVEPKDLDSRLLAEFTKDCDVYSVRIIYLRYLAYFRRDLDRATKELLTVCDSQKLTEEFYMLIFKELFYCALIKNDKDYINANAEEAVNYLSYEMHATDYRIHATYRAYIGDKDWAKLLIKSGEENLPKFLEKGIAQAELDALSELKEKIN